MQTQEKTLDTKSSSAGQIDLVLAKIYHEAPDDVFEVIVSKLLYVRVMWSLNIFRLVNKRCKRFAESCTTRLTNVDKEDGPGYLPITIIQRCRNIESIDCQSCNLSSLEGCPRGLKRLEICALYVYDFSPLAFCPLMESITIMEPCGTDISFVASMPLLTEFSCLRDREGTYAEHYESIEGLSALKSCPRLKKAEFWRIEEVNDLSFLSACLALEYLDISKCPRITDLAPLSNLNNLKQLICFDIFPEASVLPLTSCAGLKILKCNEDAADLDELRRRKPGLELTLKKRW